LVQTSDGGYVITGDTDSYGTGGVDLWIVKTDTDGNMQWSKTFGGLVYDSGYSVVQTNDGGYALAGYTASFGSSYDFWLVKTDTNGNLIWAKTYGGTSDDYAYSVVQTNDGGYALAGYTNSIGAGSSDAWLVKTDANGNTQWNKTYGGASTDYAYSVIQAKDGAYAIAGHTSSFSSSMDILLTKTDVEAGLVWADSTANTITLYRSATDAYWNFVRVRIWRIRGNP
jgi:predicted secreted protein